jgi:hypothetical protein
MAHHESLPQFHCSTHSLGLTHNASEYTHMHCSHNAQCIDVTPSSDPVRYHIPRTVGRFAPECTHICSHNA